jgi:hypothetical protein
MTTKVSDDEVQQVRDLIIATSQYDEHYVSQGVLALRAVNALKDERDTLTSHADPLRRALERINELSVTPISGDHAAANNGKELIRAKAIARLALGLAALSSGENNNGD